MPKAPDFEIAPILEYLGADNVPRVTGRHAKMLCPFHSESRPSASVGRFSFVCFGCGVQGDAISLLRTQGGVTSYQDALQLATELTGGAGEQISPSPQWGGGSIFDLARPD